MKTGVFLRGIGRIVEVEKYDVLRFEASVSYWYDASEVEVIYEPKTVELQIWVDGMLVKRLPARLGDPEEPAKIELKVEHEWFLSRKYALVGVVYPGGDEIVIKRRRWRKLGRFGYLASETVREELEPSSAEVILIARDHRP